mmetsp:Transcript_8968/g.17403  ORF Transcript_8968/g.17403 Transcript_8968/m.17403 type:complete len:186 (-) Transcript_8968:150-707(-)
MAGYFSIESILCEETAVPVKFTVGISPGMANILDAPTGSEEVKELPFWLARELDARNYADASVPKTHDERTLAKLKTDASKHSLFLANPYYYEAGVGISVMMGTPELVQALIVAFARRYRDILDRFENTEDRNAGKFFNTLTVEERRLYMSGQSSAVHHSKWKRRILEHIEHAPIVQLSKRHKPC